MVVFNRKHPDGRVGLLTSAPGKRLDVRWGDGSSETVVSGEYFHAPFGSATFMRFVLPDTWAAAWQKDETAAIALALVISEQPGVVTSNQLARAAKELGAPPSFNSTDLQRLSPLLKDAPGVVPAPKQKWRFKGDPPTSLLPPDWRERWAYVLDAAEEHSSSPDSAGETTSPRSDVDSGPDEPTLAEPEPEAAQPEPATRAPRASDTDPRHTLADLKRTKAGDTDKRRELVTRLADADALTRLAASICFVGEPDERAAHHLISHPLEQLATLPLSAPTLKAALAKLDDARRQRILPALLLAAEVLAPADIDAWAQSGTAEALLEKWAAEVDNAPKSLRNRARASIARLSAAIVSHQPNAALSLRRTLEALLESPEAAERLLGAMALQLRGLVESPSDVDKLRTSVSRVPLRPGGARLRFLAALPADEINAESTAWLDGVSIDDLLTLPDADALRLMRGAWADHIARLAKMALSEATTRRRVFALLASAIVSESVSPEDTARAIQRLGTTEPSSTQWLKILCRSSEIEELQARLADALHDADQASQEVRSLEARLERLVAATAELQAKADRAMTSAPPASDAFALQAERDAYRLIARVLAAAEAESRRLPPEALASRLQQLARMQGIEPIGRIDDVTPFDATLHDAPGGRPSPGSPVRVGRSGYKWVRSESETEILVKALVAPE